MPSQMAGLCGAVRADANGDGRGGLLGTAHAARLAANEIPSAV